MEATGRHFGGTRPLPPRERWIAVGSTVLLLVGMPIGYLGSNTTTGDVVVLLVGTVLSLVVMAGVFLWLVPYEERPGGRPARTALMLGILAAFLVVFFWTGLPFPVGAGAIALGLMCLDAPPEAEERRGATTGVVLGSFAVALSFVGLLVS